MRNSIMQIRSGKSGGPDGILIEMLKNTMFFYNSGIDQTV